MYIIFLVQLLEGDDNRNTKWLDTDAIDSMGRSWKNIIFVGVAKISLDPLIPAVLYLCGYSVFHVCNWIVKTLGRFVHSLHTPQQSVEGGGQSLVSKRRCPEQDGNQRYKS